MKSPLTVRRALLLTSACALLQHGALVLADADPQTSFAAAAEAADGAAGGIGNGVQQSANFSAAPSAQGDVAELMRLIQSSALTELRTTYNGGYGASLFFDAREQTYYVALFQNKHFWRVIKSQDDTRAELVYANFAQQSAQLAEVEIRRAKLQAQTAFLERVIGFSQERAKRLQADLDVAQAQQAKAVEYQRQVRGEAATLRDEQEKAQSQLREVQQQVQQLQRQTEAGLPAVGR